MPHWRDDFAAFANDTTLTALTFDRRPAWVWSIDGSRLFWSNGSGVMRLGVASFAQAAESVLAPDNPLREDLAAAADSAANSEEMVMLRLPIGEHFVPSPCRCTLVTSQDGLRGVLVVVLDAAPDSKFETAANDEMLAVLFSDETTLASIDGAPDGSRQLVLEERTPQSEARVALDQLVPPRQPKPDDDSPDARALAETSLTLARQALGLSGLQEPSDAQRLAAAADALRQSIDDGPTGGPADPGPAKSLPRVSAGPMSELALAQQVDRSQAPVRFLWQTDASSRFLFVSNGLTQTLGRGADIVGETWKDISNRVGLDPLGRIGRSFNGQDTWSGLTAWWPTDGGQRVPVEMTALPVYSLDRTFQGFRGYGVIKLADTLSRKEFEARFPSGQARGHPARPRANEESELDTSKVIPIRPDASEPVEGGQLTAEEKIAFEEIASSLAIGDNGDSKLDEIESANVTSQDNERSQVEAVEPEHRGISTVADEGDREVSAARPLGVPKIVNRPMEQAAPILDASASEESEPLDELSQTRERTAALESERDAALAQIGHLSSLMDALPSGMLVLDQVGRILSANTSAEQLLGAASKPITGQVLADVVTTDDQNALADSLVEYDSETGANDTSHVPPIIVKPKNGEGELLLTLRSMTGDENFGFIASLQEVSELTRREKDLREEINQFRATSDQKSDFLAWVSHEIRTPLNAVIGFAEVLMEERFGPIDNKQYRDYARDIKASGEHVLSLVNDLLDLSKIEAGYFEINVAEMSINDVIQECLTIMYPQAHSKHVVLRTSLSQIVPKVLADKRTMRQVILNLMSNSIKYTGSGGQVIVSSSKESDGGVIIKVRDTGEGMSELDLKRAMEPFTQLGSSAHGYGTGLGLPLTKVLVEANEATFDIRSSEGEGTLATIVFPPASVIDD